MKYGRIFDRWGFFEYCSYGWQCVWFQKGFMDKHIAKLMRESLSLHNEGIIHEVEP